METSCIQKSSRDRKPYLPDVEKAVAEWVKSERMKDKAIWKKDVAEKAVAVARANGNSTFQGSDGYILCNEINYLCDQRLNLREKLHLQTKIR